MNTHRKARSRYHAPLHRPHMALAQERVDQSRSYRTPPGLCRLLYIAQCQRLSGSALKERPGTPKLLTRAKADSHGVLK